MGSYLEESLHHFLVLHFRLDPGSHAACFALLPVVAGHAVEFRLLHLQDAAFAAHSCVAESTTIAL